MATVSIIIPVLNGAKYLEKCIHSALTQTYHDLEVIVLDNASTDDTFSIASKFTKDPRLVLLKNDLTIEMFPNFNKAFRLSNGTYIKFMCVDDFLHPEAIARMVQVLDNKPGVVMARTYSRYVDSLGEDLPKERVLYRGRVTGGRIIRESVRFMTNRYCGTPSNLMFRRTEFESIGCFDEMDAFGGWANDFYACMKMLKHGDIYFIAEHLVDRTIHSEQGTHRVYEQNLVDGAHTYFRKKLLEESIIGRLQYYLSMCLCRLTNPLIRRYKLHSRGSLA